MTGFTVETIGPNDFDTIADIHAASFDDAWTAPMIRRVLSMPGAFGLVARSDENGGVLGFALTRIAVDECELLSLAVAGPFRRRGIAGALLGAAMAWASASSARRFFLEVAEDNDAALRLYAGHGFCAVGRRPDYYELRGGGSVAALTMRRTLPAGAASTDSATGQEA